VTSSADEARAAEVFLDHCALRIFFSDRSLEHVITNLCGHPCAMCHPSPGQPERREMTLYGRLADLLPIMIRLQEALAGAVQTALRIGVRLGTKPLLAHLSVEPDPD
jgi:hypothetical protein